MSRLRRGAFTGVALLAVFITAATAQVTEKSRQSAEARLQEALVAEVAAHPSLPGEILHVRSAARPLGLTLAAGLADRAAKRPLAPGHTFRIASVTKTFTAASILRLEEDGRLTLSDPIHRHLSATSTQAVRAGGYDIERMTVLHLLTHTSGLFDYATSQAFQAEALSNPRKRWTRHEQIEFAMRAGKPQFPPGQGYHYSDTGYILLAEVIERTSGQALGSAYRTLLNFADLGLQHTYLETLEPVPPGSEMAHAYLGQADTAGFDPSFDLYGGGGLVSRADDLGAFFRGLFRGKVFRRPATIGRMITVPATNRESPGGAYALGIAQRTIAGRTCWGHTGFWGTSAFHCPDIDLTIVRHYGQAQPEAAFRFTRLYDQIDAILGIRPAR